MDEYNLEISKLIPAAPAALFRAWTDTAVLAQWFRITDSDALAVAENDLRTGGDYRLDVARADGTVLRLGGLYHEISDPARLSFTWRWSFDDGEEAEDTYVALTFTETATGDTQLVVLHDEFLDEDDCDWHVELWQGILAQLAAFAAKIGA
mgnify:CR=1 FL=1